MYNVIIQLYEDKSINVTININIKERGSIFMKQYIKLMRPKHCIKNLLIFFPLIFSKNIFNANLFICTLLGFFAFSLSASTIYIIDDKKDKEKDKLHPQKKNRPIASGKVTTKNAIILAIITLIVSFVFQFLTTNGKLHISQLYILVYLILNFAYSFGLKKVPLIDVIILVSGFLIRILYGASITNINVSNWLYLTIMSVSFYFALGKRRNEIKKSSDKTREVLKYYNKEFLDKNMYMCLSLAIVFYALWTVESSVIMNGNLLIWTVPIIIIILMKYSMNIESDSFGDPVDVIIEDKILLGLIMIYGISVISIIYLN